MIELLLLDNPLLKSLAARDDIVAEFPFFAVLRTAEAPQGCGVCGAKAKTMDAFNSVKLAIHELPAERKARFKQLVNAKQVRLRFIDRRGVFVKLTF
jgi:hypothetical protein